MNNALVFLILLSVLFFSCKQEKERSIALFSEVQFQWLAESENSSLPYLFSDGETLLLSFVTQTDSLATLFYSELKNEQWANPKKIVSGTDWFVNWADYPQISKNGAHYIAHILQKSDSATFAYDVMVTQKQEGGAWSIPFKIHNDTTKTEHGFVSYSPFGESQFLVNWLDGRNTSGSHHEHGGAMTLRAAAVNTDGSLENEVLLDNRICDCCQTSSAMTANGPVIVYRDRSEEEVRDIAIVRFEDGKWSTPSSVHHDNWQIHGCPVNGPRVSAQGENLAVAWFTAAGNESKVQVAFSKNSGADFEPPLRVDLKNPLGRVDIAMIDSNNAVVSWMEDQEEETFIFFRTLSSDGRLGEIMTLTSSDASRSSGFPQMVIFNEKIYFAWTVSTEDKLSIKTKSIALNKLL